MTPFRRPGLVVVIQAFLRWLETARAGDRVKAATALGKAFLRPELEGEQRQAALLAICHLLNDSSPQVRLALARVLSHSPSAPRAVMIALAEDQPEIAGTVISQSPVLSDADLVELAAAGTSFTRCFMAARRDLSRPVSAALAEIGDLETALVLLENHTAAISRLSLGRIAERFGHCADVRHLLLERADLPSEARQKLVLQVSTALAQSELVRAVLASHRVEQVTGEARQASTLVIAGEIQREELPLLVEQLRSTESLTPALLIQALCTGKVEFFSQALVALSGLDERRVRSILASGRMHAVRALLESSGIRRDLAMVFVEATLLWREMGEMAGSERICGRLLAKCDRSKGRGDAVSQLLDLVEKLERSQLRAVARSYAVGALMAA